MFRAPAADACYMRLPRAFTRPIARCLVVWGLLLSVSSCSSADRVEESGARIPVDLGSGGLRQFEGRNGVALYSVVAGAVLSDGFAVAERAPLAVSFFDTSGAFVSSVGGPGEGPGEFRDILWLRSTASGVVVYDPVLRRLTEFTSAGSLTAVHRISLQEVVSGADLMGLFDDGTALAAALRPNFPASGIGVYRHRAVAYRVDIEGSRADSMFSMQAEEQFIARGKPNFMGPPPYGAPSWISVSATNAYSVDNTDEFVSIWDAEGRRVGQLSVTGAYRRPISSEDMRDARDRFKELITPSRADLLRFFDMMPVPDSSPYFGWAGEEPIKPLNVTRRGHVFVTLYGGLKGRGTEVAVFGPDHQFMYTLVFDSAARVLDAADSEMIVQSWNEDGVEAVQLFSFSQSRTNLRN